MPSHVGAIPRGRHPQAPLRLVRTGFARENGALRLISQNRSRGRPSANSPRPPVIPFLPTSVCANVIAASPPLWRRPCLASPQAEPGTVWLHRPRPSSRARKSSSYDPIEGKIEIG